MSGFKKKLNDILNPEIFKIMFEYMDKQFKLFAPGIIDECDNNRKIAYKTPFQFGFEEQGITNILLPFFIINKVDIIIIPMYFDYGAQFKFFYEDLLLYFTPQFRSIIRSKLGLHEKNIQLLTFVDPLYGYNIHFGIILVNLLHKLITNNKYKINNVDIINLTDIDKLKRTLSIKGFYNMYPSFNISVNIETIFAYIDELYNGTNNLPNLVPKKLPKEAYNEFGKDSRSSYQNYVDESIDQLEILHKRPTIKILESSILYKGTKGGYEAKYLKYKSKYLELKRQLLNN